MIACKLEKEILRINYSTIDYNHFSVYLSLFSYSCPLLLIFFIIPSSSSFLSFSCLSLLFFDYNEFKYYFYLRLFAQHTHTHTHTESRRNATKIFRFSSSSWSKSFRNGDREFRTCFEKVITLLTVHAYVCNVNVCTCTESFGLMVLLYWRRWV